MNTKQELALEQATELYQQPHLNESQRQALLTALGQLSPEALTDFIRTYEKLIITDGCLSSLIR